MYRQICKTVDAVLENYAFYLDMQFTTMPQIYAEKTKGLKELYASAMLLESKVLAYKKAIGSKPDHDLMFLDVF